MGPMSWGDSGFCQERGDGIFGDNSIYLEKYLQPSPYRFKIWRIVLGNCVHCGERNCWCSAATRKLVEDSTKPGRLLRQHTKENGAGSGQAAKSINYEGAGTVEFILSGDKFYFMEMNTRIQVEHPVTEFITGIDLIKAQIRVASGQPLGYKQHDIEFRGHAIECRINAEDPDRNFLPSPGRIDAYIVPGGPGVRVDSHCASRVLDPFLLRFAHGQTDLLGVRPGGGYPENAART